MKKVELYTDGSCLGNPGPGGYAAILRYGEHERELCGGYCLTTNNRMELLAAICGLEALKQPCSVQLTTDSQYLVHAVEKGWLKGWIAKGWRRADKGKVANEDLWKRLAGLLEQHAVRFCWVRGHAGHPENERCDELSRQVAMRMDLPVDLGYDQNLSNGEESVGFAR